MSRSLSSLCGWRKPRARRAAPARVRPRLEPLEGRCLPSTLTVVSPADSGVGTLRDDIAAAASGDRITFDPSLSGQTITLTSGELTVDKNLTIAGPGAGQLAVSGGFLDRVFEVAQGAQLTLSGLTVTDGEANFGGGILNHGTLVLNKAAVTDNLAVGTAGAPADLFPANGPSASAEGGGVWSDFGSVLRVTGSRIAGNEALAVAGYASGGGVQNYGHAVLTASTLDDNQAVAAPGGFAQGLGGAIQNDGSGSLGASLVLSGCTVSNNQAIASDGDPSLGTRAGDAFGGGLENQHGATLQVVNSGVIGNQAVGGTGGTGGFALGGGLYNGTGGALLVTGSTVSGNAVLGGANAVFGGGLDDSFGGLATVTRSTFSGNHVLAGPGQSAFGGGISVGAGAVLTGHADHSSLTLAVLCTLTGNAAVGGSGATGAAAAGGALCGFLGSTVTIAGSTFAHNHALGGASSASTVAGPAQGGALDNRGGVWSITSSNFTGNLAVGGSNSTANGFGGAAQGGALENGGTTTVLACQFAGNEALGGAGGPGGRGGVADGGAIDQEAGTLTLSSGALRGNEAVGGTGAGGGNAVGGGLSAFTGTVTVLGPTLVTGNSATGGGGTDLGSGFGGGIFISPVFLTVRISRLSIITGNRASTSGNNVLGPFTSI
jgi:hypothetical protein